MIDEDTQPLVLDLSGRQLKKVPKQEDAQNIRVLILDNNEFQKIDNIDSYLKIETLSLSKNQLLRMYGVCRLHCLRVLNLSFNGILSIEGLKECIHLRHLNLEGNNIKTIEHLNNNINLEILNLAENNIGNISDISFLKNLKELYLHGNRLTHLRQCDKFLPTSLETLTLCKNNIADLNEICTLVNLTNLKSFSINENPCVTMTNGVDGFDHRPFVVNWLMSVKSIDGFVVDPIESLKAEWLYSQGRGRQFRVGEQATLAKYLSSVCPLIGKPLENENERKLRLILSKAQQHQRQLQEEISENSSANNSPNSSRRKSTSRIQSPRYTRLGRQGSPDSMISSYHGHSSMDQSSLSGHLQMTTSLVENIKNETSMSQSFEQSSTNSSVSHKSTILNELTRHESPYIHSNGPLAAASKMVPVPEALMSPDVCPGSVVQKVISTQIQHAKNLKNKDNKLTSPKLRNSHLHKSPNVSPRRLNQSNILQQQNALNAVKAVNVDNQSGKSRLSGNTVHITAPQEIDSGGISSDDDSEHINIDKLRTIHNMAAQRCQNNKINMETDSNSSQMKGVESSAVLIQKIWRGYRTRKNNKHLAEKLREKRTYEYVEQLAKDMEEVKPQIDNQREIQQLHGQAISILWKKVKNIATVSRADGEDYSAASGDKCEQHISLDSNSTAVVSDLVKTCYTLTNQVQQLQSSMLDILNCLSVFCNLPPQNVRKLLTAGVNEALNNMESQNSVGTQTDITAVRTPQPEMQTTNFPYAKPRPSTLPLEIPQTQQTFEAKEALDTTAESIQSASEVSENQSAQNSEYENSEN